MTKLSPEILATRETGDFAYGGVLERADLRGANLAALRLEDPSWTGCDFRDASFEDFRCMGGNLSQGRWEGAALGGARMMDVAFASGVFDGCWMERGVFPACDFRRCSLVGVDLALAELLGAVFDGANLRDANLEGARCVKVSFRGADLRGANLAGADLTQADLRGAMIEGAIFEGANTSEAVF